MENISSDHPRPASAIDAKNIKVPSAQNSNIVTVVRDVKNPLGKHFKRNADGTFSKSSTVTVSCGLAVMHRIDTHDELASLLKDVGDDPHAAIINAAFAGIEVGEQFVILSERQIEKRLGIPRSDRERQKGVHDIMLDGKSYKAVGRFKENIRTSCWNIIDRDIDQYTPAEFANLSYAEWLQAMGKIMPGLERVSHVRTASTSSRVLLDGQPVGAGNGHVWIKVADPHDIERARTASIVQAANLGMTWQKPRHSRTEPGKIVGKSLTTICDPSVWTPGRLIFIGKPVADEGLTVAPPSVVVHHGENDTLDTAAIVLPDADAVRRITREAGIEMDVQTGGNGLRITAQDLTLDTEIDTEDHGRMTVRQIIEKGITGKIRCQTPFRDSNSFAAFVSLGADGTPFIHDVGTGITHWLNEYEADDLLTRSGDCGEAHESVAAQALAVITQNDAADYQGIGAEITHEPGEPIPENDTKATTSVEPARNNSVPVHHLDDAEPLGTSKFPNQGTGHSGEKLPATIPNLRYMLSAYGISVRYNVISKKLEIIIPGFSGCPDNADNSALAQIISLATLNNIPTGQILYYLCAIADRNQYSPVTDWINCKPWVGTDRLQALYDTLVAREDFPKTLKEVLLYRWLLSTIAAALKSGGFRARGVLTLQGPQSIGKTAWISALVPDPMLRDAVIKLDHHLDAGSKDSIITAICHWIVEIGELDSSFKKDIARLKGVITSDRDKVRRPYARVDSEYPRRTVFCATVNDPNFLVDDTGNTRWWIIPVTSINYEHGIDMQQVFAQLAVDFHKGERWWLTEQEEQRLEEQNKDHRRVSVIREHILDGVDPSIPPEKRKAMTAAQVLKTLGFERPTNTQAKECAAVLRELYGEPKRIRGQSKWRVPLREWSSNSVAYDEDDLH